MTRGRLKTHQRTLSITISAIRLTMETKVPSCRNMRDPFQAQCALDGMFSGAYRMLSAHGKLNAVVFIFHFHDDILGKIAEMLSEQIHAAHVLAVRIHPEDERKEIIL